MLGRDAVVAALRHRNRAPPPMSSPLVPAPEAKSLATAAATAAAAAAAAPVSGASTPIPSGACIEGSGQGGLVSLVAIVAPARDAPSAHVLAFTDVHCVVPAPRWPFMTGGHQEGHREPKVRKVGIPHK